MALGLDVEDRLAIDENLVASPSLALDLGLALGNRHRETARPRGDYLPPPHSESPTDRPEPSAG